MSVNKYIDEVWLITMHLNIPLSANVKHQPPLICGFVGKKTIGKESLLIKIMC